MFRKESESHIHVPEYGEILVIEEFHPHLMSDFNGFPDILFHTIEVSRESVTGKQSVQDNRFHSSFPDLFQPFSDQFRGVEFVKRSVIGRAHGTQGTVVSP